MCFFHFCITWSNATIWSSDAVLLLWIWPHCKHTNVILMVPWVRKYDCGTISPLQLDALSQGVRSSTCNDTKQWGQWFLDVFSALGIMLPQLIQTNHWLLVIILIDLYQLEKLFIQFLAFLLITYNVLQQLITSKSISSPKKV